MGTKSADVAVGGGPPANGWRFEKTGGPAQVASPGPNAVNTTVPVGAGAGAGAPVTVAVSRTGLPRVTGLSADVAMVTGAWVTTDASPGAPQGPVVGA